VGVVVVVVVVGRTERGGIVSGGGGSGSGKSRTGLTLVMPLLTVPPWVGERSHGETGDGDADSDPKDDADLWSSSIKFS
jgi:hypothetical protein